VFAVPGRQRFWRCLLRFSTEGQASVDANVLHTFDAQALSSTDVHDPERKSSLTTLLKLGVGFVISMYVIYCLITQKVWIRKVFAWRTRDEYPKIFLMNIIGGTLIAIWLIAGPLLID
jgi:hypothetical protein